MTTQVNVDASSPEPDARQIADYLTSHPSFFDEQPDLLADLRLPHSSGAAVSLVERQILVLREQNRELKRKLLELVDVARDNDRLNERMHRMTLDLLRSDSLHALLDTLKDHLHNEFKADAVAVQLTGLVESRQRDTWATRLEPDEAVKALFNTAFVDSRPQCGRLKKEQLDFLFGDQATAIESAIVVPLGKRSEQGLIAIGSREVSRFNPCMGTLFMSHLAELLVVFLQRQGIL